MMGSLLKPALLLLSCLLLSTVTCAENLPGLGDGSGVITPAQERGLGQSWLRRLRGQAPLVDDPLLTDYLQDVIYRLVPNSGINDPRLSLVVVDSPELNAFAVPGGVIGINGGLILHAQTEQEMASVLAHELAHLSQRHFARRLEQSSQQMAMNMAGILASVLLAATAGSDAGIAALASSQAFSAQQQLQYSRDNEQEADRIGLITLTNSGMNAQSMVDMFQRMAQSQRFTRQIPEYLRTHPLTESRVSDMAARAAELPVRVYRENQDYYYVRARLRVAYSENLPELGVQFRREQQSGRREVRLAALFGEVLAFLRMNRPEAAATALEQLLAEDPNRITVTFLQSEWLQASGQMTQARQLLETNLDRNPGNYALNRRLVQVLVSERRHAEAFELLRRLSLEHDDDVGIWYELAEVAGQAGRIVDLHRARAEFFFLRGQYASARQQLQQALAKSAGNYQETVLIRARLNDLSQDGEYFRF